MKVKSDVAQGLMNAAKQFELESSFTMEFLKETNIIETSHQFSHVKISCFNTIWFLNNLI